eukprot:8319902-Heterocapsa_arctica.AAC.1
MHMHARECLSDHCSICAHRQGRAPRDACAKAEQLRPSNSGRAAPAEQLRLGRVGSSQPPCDR